MACGATPRLCRIRTDDPAGKVAPIPQASKESHACPLDSVKFVPNRGRIYETASRHHHPLPPATRARMYGGGGGGLSLPSRIAVTNLETFSRRCCASPSSALLITAGAPCGASAGTMEYGCARLGNDVDVDMGGRPRPEDWVMMVGSVDWED